MDVKLMMMMMMMMMTYGASPAVYYYYYYYYPENDLNKYADNTNFNRSIINFPYGCTGTGARI